MKLSAKKIVDFAEAKGYTMTRGVYVRCLVGILGHMAGIIKTDYAWNYIDGSPPVHLAFDAIAKFHKIKVSSLREAECGFENSVLGHENSPYYKLGKNVAELAEKRGILA